MRFTIVLRVDGRAKNVTFCCKSSGYVRRTPNSPRIPAECWIPGLMEFWGPTGTIFGIFGLFEGRDLYPTCTEEDILTADYADEAQIIYHGATGRRSRKQSESWFVNGEWWMIGRFATHRKFCQDCAISTDSTMETLHLIAALAGSW